MNNKCEISGCLLDRFENETKCILHCDKTVTNGWILSEDKPIEPGRAQTNVDDIMLWDNDKVNLFWETLFFEIKKTIILYIRKKPSINGPIFILGAHGKNGFTIFFMHIKFPCLTQEISKFIKSNNTIVKKNQFQDCTFYDNCVINISDLATPNELDSKGLQQLSKNRPIAFFNCKFEHNFILLRPYSIDEDLSLTECTINKSINIESTFSRLRIYDNSCQNITINGSGFTSSKINDLDIKNLNAQDLKISTLTIDELKINNIDLESFILDNIDLNNTAINNIKTNNFSINEINFIDDSKIVFEKITTKNLSINQLSQKSKYIQFHNINVTERFECERADFKNTYFYDFNISDAAKKISKTSFLDANLSSIKWGNIFAVESTKEMYRQLKFVNDKQGNYIEANNFYSKEMESHKKEIFNHQKNQVSWQEKIVFFLGEKISNFGQSWLLPLSWLILINLIFYTYVTSYPSIIWFFFAFLVFSLLIGSLLDRVFNIIAIKQIALMIGTLSFINYFNIGNLHNFTAFISIQTPDKLSIVYTKFLHIWYLNKVISSFIVYYLVIALRRHTRR